MRVHQLRLRNSRGEEGAVAVTVALLSTVLIGVAAFTVDLGGAYLAKRDTANATDAASLAAAKEFAAIKGTCATVAADPTAFNAARASGDTYLADNVNSATRTVFTAACDATGKSVEVRYGADATVDRAFSGVFGGSGKLAVNREATAAVGVATDVNGLRPYAICAADLPLLQLLGVRQVNFPNDVCGSQPGNWYSIDCPDSSGKNSTPELADNTANGCKDDISIVKTDDLTDPGAIVSRLIAKCPGRSADPGCLSGNTGQLPSDNITDAFNKILDKEILLPVFYAYQDSTGNHTSVYDNGNNTIYPVYAFVGVTMCGYHFQNKERVGTGPVCAGSSFTEPATSKGGGKYDAMLLKLTNVISSGSTKASTCSLGSIVCDFGARTVRLVK